MIRKRFPDEIIEKVLTIDCSAVSHVKGDNFEPVWDRELILENYQEMIENFWTFKILLVRIMCQ